MFGKKRIKFNIILLVVVFLFIFGEFSNAAIIVKSSLLQEKTAGIGESYKGVILINNNDTAAKKVKIYQTDYTFNYKGESVYGEPGKNPHSNADWIKFDSTYLTIFPREEVKLNYTVNVPDDESLAGSYWSVVMIEGIKENAPVSSEAKKGEVKVGIQTLVRYAVQIITNIGDSGSREINILNKELVKGKDGEYSLKMNVENIGERALRPIINAELYNLQGLLAGKFKGNRARIYPRTSAGYQVDFKDVPTGKYKALITLDNGDDYVWGIQINLEL